MCSRRYAPALAIEKIVNGAISELSGAGDGDYTKYANDPVGFCEKELGDKLTDQIKEVAQSLVNNRITLVRSCNAPGKSHFAARSAIWFYKSFFKPKVFIAAAPPFRNLETILWSEIGGIIYKNPKLFKSDDIKSLYIGDGTGESFIQGVSIPSKGTDAEKEGSFSGKHAPNMLFIFDEGDAIQRFCYRGAEASMSGGNSRMLILFNPRHKSGYLEQMERKGLANVIHLSAFDHPNVIEGRDIFAGAVRRDTTIQRINDWSRELAPKEEPDMECFEVPEFLVGCDDGPPGTNYNPLKPGYRRITDPQFSYMVLGQYPAQSSAQLISEDSVYKARARWDAYVAQFGEKPPEHTSGVMGLDVGELGNDPSCIIKRYGGFITRPRTWKGVDPNITAEIAAEEYKDGNCYAAHVDSTGVGSGVPEGMIRLGCNAIGIKVGSSAVESCEFGEFNLLRDQIAWQVREWLRKDTGAMLPPDEELIEELLAYEYWTGDTNFKIQVSKKSELRVKLGRSTDKFDALAMAIHETRDYWKGYA